MSKSSEPVLHDAAVPYRFQATIHAGRELDFPDWNGQVTLPRTLSMEEMLRFCEASFAHVRSFPGYKARRRQGRCDAEFVLTT